MEPVNGIKDVCGAKLQPMTVSAYPVDCDHLCHLLDTQYCCLCLNGSLIIIHMHMYVANYILSITYLDLCTIIDILTPGTRS